MMLVVVLIVVLPGWYRFLEVGTEHRQRGKHSCTHILRVSGLVLVSVAV